MSLKLLQKAAASSGSGGGRGGRGRGRQGRTMSLQEFQKSETGPNVTAKPRTVSAWGRGRPEAAAVGASPAAPIPGVTSRGRGARQAPEPRQSAWARGAPQSTVDALWDAPAAQAAVGESSWDEPAEEPETLGEEEPSCWDEASWDAAPAVDWQGADEAHADVQEDATAAPVAVSSEQHEEEEDEEDDFSREVAAWLKELKLSEYEEAVLSWCEEMGAATLQEVVDCIPDLLDEISMKPMQKKRMQMNGVQAAAAISSGVTAPASQASVPTRATSRVQDVASDALTANSGYGDDVGDNGRSGTWCSGGGSFYSRSNSTGAHAGDGGEPAAPPQSFYGHSDSLSPVADGSEDDDDEEEAEDGARIAGGDVADGGAAPGGFYANAAAGGFYSSNASGFWDAGDDAEGSRLGEAGGGGGFYASKASADERDETRETELEDDYLKQRFTERATWLPAVKVSQGERKKKGSQPQKQSAVSEEEKAAKEAAQRRLREQLEEEERQRTAVVREALETAIEEGNPDEVRRAIKEAREAGMGADELREAEVSLERILRRQMQRRQDAVCALQAALEAPRDDKFGSVLRQALEAKADAREVEGGQEWVDRAQAALQGWQAEQQKRQNAKMALQLAVRHASFQAMRVALENAHEAGLADDDKLVVEATLKLREADERRELDAAAENRLQRALDAHDLDDLELAIAECVNRNLPLHGADHLLETWREEEMRRSAAAARLHEAMEAEDKDVIKAALHEAREAYVEASLISAAEHRIQEIQVAAKRLHNASVELHLARSSRDAGRLEAAIAEGRALGLDAAAITAAVQQLTEVREEERLKREARESLASAIRSRDLFALHAALEAAEGVLPGDLREVSRAREVRAQVEREQRIAEEERKRQAAEADLRDAIARADWHGIQATQQRARTLGFAEDCEVMTLADSTLEELRDAHEVEEAKRLVENTEERLAYLAQREAELSGAAHKKERSAIGKEALGLKNDSAYLSAVRFLKNPAAERKRREDRRLASERRAAEESERRAQRCLEAHQELSTAISSRDETAVQALLEEEILDQTDKQSAEAFLVEQAERIAATAKDGALLQFSYASLLRRDFFGASIAMNEFLTDQYSMQEGADFKLKVLKRGNSVLVAFRSTEFAEVVLDTAKQLASRLNSGHVVASAEICGPADFTDEVEESLPDARQDAENLQRRPVRRESQHAVKSVRRRLTGGIGDSSSTVGQSVAAAKRQTGGNNAFAALSPEQTGTEAGVDAADADGAATEMARPTPRGATVRLRPTGEVDADGFVRAGHGGNRTESTPSASSAYPGKGRSRGKGGTSPSAENTIPLPRWAADMLQRDRAQAELFRQDLKTFARVNRVVAELQGLSCVVMKPMGFVHQETMQRARSELQRLLDHYFPQQQAPVSDGAAAETYVLPEPTSRCAHLRVSEDGAGIEMTPTTDGYRVDYVEDFPGQDFTAGEVIIEINGVPLVGLDEEALEDTFGEHFGDGAALTVMALPQ